jgi:hypothetical protein
MALHERGQRFHALKSGRRQGRVNRIAALCQQKLMAPFTVVGSCNRTVFEIWLESCLIPLLKPGQVVVMDNATFHKGGRIEQLIHQAGCDTKLRSNVVDLQECMAVEKSILQQ